jgi:hypothetical protein
MIWRPGFKGANATAGHIAYLIGASYNSTTSKWTFDFVDANGAFTGASQYTSYDCTNVRRNQWSTNDISGLTFFRATGNVARGRPANSTSVEGSLYGPLRAVDGSMNTRWSSRIIKPPHSDWWWVELSTPYRNKFNQIAIKWEAAYASRYFVGWSNDCSNFTGYWRSRSGAGTDFVGTGGRVSAKCVGVYMTQVAPCCWNYSFWEVEAINIVP